MALESRLWEWLKKARLSYRDDLHMTRVENGVSAGMPDVEGHLKRGGQFWIELKSAARPKHPDTPVRFRTRTAQVEWVDRRRAVGGRAWYLLQVGDGADRRIYLLDGMWGAMIHAGQSEQWLSDHSAIGRAATQWTVIAVATGGIDG